MSEGPAGLRTVTIQFLLDPKNAPNIKNFYVLDGNGDPTAIFHAQASAGNGDSCLKQRLTYQTISGNKNLQKVDWINATWSSAYDVD